MEQKEMNRKIADVLQEFCIIKDAFETRYYELYGALSNMADVDGYKPVIEAQDLLDRAMWNNVEDQAQTDLNTFLDAIDKFPDQIYLHMEPYKDCVAVRCVFDSQQVYAYVSYEVRIAILNDASNNELDIEDSFDEGSNMYVVMIEMKTFDQFANWIAKYIA